MTKLDTLRWLIISNRSWRHYLTKSASALKLSMTPPGEPLTLLIKEYLGKEYRGSKSSTVTDVILPIAATAGMVAGTVALFYVTAKGKLNGIAVRVQQAIPLIVRTPKTLLSHMLNQDIEEYTLPALNEV